MNKRERIEQEIEKTLECFDRAEHLKVDPYFYTRLQARIKDIEKRKRFSWQEMLSVKALRPILLTAIVVLNIFTAMMVFQGTDRRTDTREQCLTDFAEEYSLDLESGSSQILE